MAAQYIVLQCKELPRQLVIVNAALIQANNTVSCLILTHFSIVDEMRKYEHDHH